MITVSFTQAVEFHTGRIGLTDKQAVLRSRRLVKIRKGLYDITGTVQFKAGEKIGLGEIPKSYRHLLSAESAAVIEEAEQKALNARVKAEADAIAKAEAEAKARADAEAAAKQNTETGAE